MKKILLLLGLLGFFIVTTAAGDEPRNLITVSAQGEIEAEPDLAVVVVGAVTTELQALDAYNKNNQIIERVIAAVTGSGINKKDIKTTRFSLAPQYDHSERQRKFIGYEVRHTLAVNVRNIKKVGMVLDRATEAGANDIGSISFTIDDPTKLESIARERAVKAAHAKAQEMAKAAGVKLGKVVQISESAGYRPRPADFEKGVAFESAAAAPIEAGTLTIQISVTIQYEIEQ